MATEVRTNRRMEENSMTNQTELANIASGSLPTKQDLDETVSRATDVAQVLKRIIDDQHLSVKIGQGNHVRVEAWQTVGRFCGYVARSEEIQTDDPGALAKATITRLSDGQVVSTATARCGTPGDAPWEGRPANDQASMAQTRAVGKGFRNVLSWIVVLAGYEATPAEEMPKDRDDQQEEHFCLKHKVPWFKKGRMRSYAHPIEGSADWCNMPEPAQEQPTMSVDGRNEPEPSVTTPEPTEDPLFDDPVEPEDPFKVILPENLTHTSFSALCRRVGWSRENVQFFLGMSASIWCTENDKTLREAFIECRGKAHQAKPDELKF